MPSTEAQKRASTNFNRKQDSLMTRTSKAEGARIRAAAAQKGMSVQAYILDTLRARMDADGVPCPAEENIED